MPFHRSGAVAGISARFTWGDVPALAADWSSHEQSEAGGGSWFAIGAPGQTLVGNNPDGRNVPGFRFDGNGSSFRSAWVGELAYKASWHELERWIQARNAASLDCRRSRNDQGLRLADMLLTGSPARK